MKPCKIIPLILLLYTISPLFTVYGETENFFSDNVDAAEIQEKFLLDNGKIYREEKSLRELPIEGKVIGIDNYNGILYYIRESGEGWIAGSFKHQSGITSEFQAGQDFSSLLKLKCRDNIFYFLADFIPGNNSDNAEFSEVISNKQERALVRLDPDKNEKKIIRGVDDFILTDKGLIMLTASGINSNGFVIPFTLQGKRYIDRVIDSRFVFLSNGNEFEVIDIISQRNIYTYRAEKAFPYSPDYNIILEFNDTGAPKNQVSEMDNMIYYQVSVNGVETGRTETALSNIVSSSMIKAETGKYCIIKAERWELDRIKGRYIRVNNIYQPEAIRLYVPENRIIKIRFDFDGEKYILNQSVYEN